MRELNDPDLCENETAQYVAIKQRRRSSVINVMIHLADSVPLAVSIPRSSSLLCGPTKALEPFIRGLRMSLLDEHFVITGSEPIY